MMYSIYDDYKDLDINIALAIVPVKGFNISKKYKIENINIYPKKTIGSNELRGFHFDFSFEEISEEFYDSTLLVFPIEYKRKNIMGSLMPSEKDKLIKNVLGLSEDIMNVFRYISSNFDKVSNLPQRAGYIRDIISGFLIYYRNIKSSDYISDKYYSINKSIGRNLQINVDEVKESLDKYCVILRQDSGEIGNILKQALRLYSDILYMSTSTNKFMQGMSLIEYLANPFEYEKMKKVKTKIIPFSVDSKKQYNIICERFKQLTSLEDENNKQIGFRTLIIHNGRTLESIFDEGYKVDLLLRELQTYICNFINALMPYYNEDWEFAKKIIEEKYDEIQNIKSGYDGKYEADIAIIIDFEFLNKAIKEVYQLYPQYINKKFNIAKFITLLMVQSDINRKGYQIPIQIIYSNDDKIFNETDNRKVSDLEALGFDSPLGETTIYTFHSGLMHQQILNELIQGYLIEGNYNINIPAKYTKIIWISDRNNIKDRVFIEAENSCKKLILGRLDNKRTTCYDKCTWFDLELVIMSCLEIDYTEECVDDFIFNPSEGRYK